MSNILYTIGHTQKSAEDFFTSLEQQHITLLVDIRLNNVSQLAAFAKAKDLKYFLKTILGCKYIYLPEFAPSKELLKNYQEKKISWSDYEREYNAQLKTSSFEEINKIIITENTCLMCSEILPEKCHRRLLAEYLQQENKNITVAHL